MLAPRSVPADRLSQSLTTAPEGAAAYLGLTRKRIYDLKSAGALTPDGYDGRTPLFRLSTLDNYVRS